MTIKVGDIVRIKRQYLTMYDDYKDSWARVTSVEDKRYLALRIEYGQIINNEFIVQAKSTYKYSYVNEEFLMKKSNSLKDLIGN